MDKEQYIDNLTREVSGLQKDLTSAQATKDEYDLTIKEISALNRFSRMVTENLSVEQVVNSALHEIKKTIVPDLVFIFQNADEDLKLLGLHKSSSFFDDTFFKNHRAEICLCGLAATGEPVFSKNIQNDTRCTLMECKKAGLHSFAVIPLCYDNSVIGGLGLATFEEVDFQEQSEFLEALANQLAIGLKNAFMFESVAAATNEQHIMLRELEEAKGALQERENLLQSIFKSAPVGIGLVVSRTFKWTNHRLTEITGYTADELLNQNARMLYSTEEDYQLVGKEKYDQIKKYGTGSVETHWKTKDNSNIHVFLSSTPLDSKDLSQGVVFTALDITKRKKNEEQLQMAKEEWEKSFNAINNIITIQDKNMHITRVNTAACRFFEAEPEELIGRKCYEVFRGQAEPCLGCPELKSLDDLKHHSEVIRHEELGKTFHVESAPILDTEGNIEYLVHAAKDITEQIKMEEELFQSRKMEAIGTLAGGIAHDFNNILAAVLGYAELAKINIDDKQEALEDLEAVIKSSHRAKELVKQILTFSRKAEHTSKPLSPYLIVKESMKLLRASIPKSIEINEDIDTESGMILADPTKLQQVIFNLCTNALHSMENEQGVLGIKLAQCDIGVNELYADSNASPGRYIVFSVTDSGHGMDPETVQRIFEPYFTTKDVGKGSGMGLALVHSIVQDFNGFIKVGSQPGIGTSFRVYIPVFEEKSIDEFQQEAISDVLPTGTERILVIDDESIIVNMQKAVLEGQGYQVTAMNNSKDAFEKFMEDPDAFDLVLTDQTMPQLPGSELAKKMLKIRPDIPIILSTGYSSIISDETAKEIGIKAFAMKPVNRRQLLTLVRDLLDDN